jgi:hypothetical protein
MLSKYKLEVGPRDAATKVTVPRNEVGVVQEFIRRTGHRFADKGQFKAFLANPEGFLRPSASTPVQVQV